MRVIAQSTLVKFMEAHPETIASATHWYSVTKAADWNTVNDVQQAFSKAKALNGERVRFEIAGGNYRLIVAFNFKTQVAFIKFVGTHAEYDAVNALTVSQF